MNAVNMIGMIFITVCICWLAALELSGVIHFCWRNITAPMNSGSTK